MNVTDPLFPSGTHTSRGGSTANLVENLVSTGIESLTTVARLPLSSSTQSAAAPNPTSSGTSVSSNQHFWGRLSIPRNCITTGRHDCSSSSCHRFHYPHMGSHRISLQTVLACRPMCPPLSLTLPSCTGSSIGSATTVALTVHCSGGTTRSYATFVLYTVLVPGVQGIIAIWALYRAIRLRRRRRLWAFFALLVVVSVLVEVFVDYPALTSWGFNAWLDEVDQDSNGWTEFRPVPLTWIPWVFLLGYWISDLHSNKNRDKPSAFPFGILKNQRTLSFPTPWRTEKAQLR